MASDEEIDVLVADYFSFSETDNKDDKPGDAPFDEEAALCFIQEYLQNGPAGPRAPVTPRAPVAMSDEDFSLMLSGPLPKSASEVSCESDMFGGHDAVRGNSKKIADMHARSELAKEAAERAMALKRFSGKKRKVAAKSSPTGLHVTVSPLNDTMSSQGAPATTSAEEELGITGPLSPRMVAMLDVLVLRPGVKARAHSTRSQSALCMLGPDVILDLPVDGGPRMQGYKCFGCYRSILPGPERNVVEFEDSRWCHYTGKYFCPACHLEDLAVIPARVVHEWNFSLYQVSCVAREHLLATWDVPLPPLRALSPFLYEHVQELRSIATLRAQLSSLGGYILTCREVNTLLPSNISAEYLMGADSDVFSMKQLTGIHDGRTLLELRHMTANFIDHILDRCSLCFLKGHICEFCQSSSPIFPFQFRLAVQCQQCKAYYHRRCYSIMHCPKCLRIRRKHFTATMRELQERACPSSVDPESAEAYWTSVDPIHAAVFKEFRRIEEIPPFPGSLEAKIKTRRAKSIMFSAAAVQRLSASLGAHKGADGRCARPRSIAAMRALTLPPASLPPSRSAPSTSNPGGLEGARRLEVAGRLPHNYLLPPRLHASQ